MRKLKIFTILGIIASLVLILSFSIKVNAEDEVPVEENTELVTNTNEDDWVDKWLGPDKVATYFSYLLYIGTIIGLVANVKKLKQSNNLTLNNVSDNVKGVLVENIKTSVNNTMDKYLPMIVASQEKSNEIMTVFAKILTLSQENTPESKVAILDLIEQLGTVNNELIEMTKQFVLDTQKAIEEKAEKVEKQVDEIIEKYDGTSV